MVRSGLKYPLVLSLSKDGVRFALRLIGVLRQAQDYGFHFTVTPHINAPHDTPTPYPTPVIASGEDARQSRVA